MKDIHTKLFKQRPNPHLPAAGSMAESGYVPVQSLERVEAERDQLLHAVHKAGNDQTKLERLRNGDYKEAVMVCEKVARGE